MDVKLPLYRQHRLSVPNSIQRLQPKRNRGVLKALHPENLKISRGGSTKQRLCDRRSALGNRGDALSGSVTAASGRTDRTGRSRCDHRRTSAPAFRALPLWVMFQLHIVLEISGFPPEHCIQHCQKLPLQRMEQ